MNNVLYGMFHYGATKSMVSPRPIQEIAQLADNLSFCVLGMEVFACDEKGKKLATAEI